MRKKILAAFIVAAGVAFAGYNMIQTQNEKDALADILMANVEALANGGETSTTWKCSGWWGTCKATCGLCGTRIEGSGSPEGTHSCSKK